MELSSKDLQIGDWILLVKENRPIRVDLLTISEIEDLESLGKVVEHFYKPIKVTPKILEENGFECYSDSAYNIVDNIIYSWRDSTIYGIYTTQGPYGHYYDNSIIVNTLEYVHELQHFLKLRFRYHDHPGIQKVTIEEEIPEETPEEKKEGSVPKSPNDILKKVQKAIDDTFWDLVD